MSKKEEEKPGIIPLNERDDETEAEVAINTARILASNPFRVSKKYTHIEIPEFKESEKKERLTWELEEIRRCREGFGGLSGRYYFFLNHCKIKHKSRGLIRPDFRAWQMNFGAVKDRIQKTPGLGLVSIKRRQVGASWDYAADNIYDCTFNRNYDIGMNSKGELDSQEFFKKHKFIHRNLPKFLRAECSVDRRDAMIFSKYVKRTGETRGTGSSIISTSPVPTAHAGRQYRKLVIDEAGLQEELMALWSQSEDCIKQDTVRVGTPYIFGSVGDTTKQGKGLMEFWLNNEVYSLERFGIYGYNGLLCDDLGNDMIEDAVRYILYTRKKLKNASPVVYNTYVQNFPLNDDDALLTVKGSGVGNPILLGKQRIQLIENPPLIHKGWMRERMGGAIDFVPDDVNGKVIIYERPQQISHGYVSAIDPIEDDDVVKSRDSSNMASAIVKKPFGTEAPKLVAEYVDRPDKLSKYYDQLRLLLQWYNNTSILCEMNKGGGRLKDWFEKEGYKHLLQLTPKKVNSLRQGYEMTVGIKKTPERDLQMRGLGDAFVEEYWDTIPSIRLIDEFRVYGSDHEDDDFATAFLYCLVTLQSDRRAATAIDHNNSLSPKFTYQKVGKTIQLLPDGHNPSSPTRPRINNPLFNR